MSTTEKTAAKNERKQEAESELEKVQNIKEVLASKVGGVVKWVNVMSGSGFIQRDDTKEDVFADQAAIIKNNIKKAIRFARDRGSSGANKGNQNNVTTRGHLPPSGAEGEYTKRGHGTPDHSTKVPETTLMDASVTCYTINGQEVLHLL